MSDESAIIEAVTMKSSNQATFQNNNMKESIGLDSYISVPEFYHGRSIFITGGTGFMGKVLVEKLLRSCPGIKSIFLLIRPKRGQEINLRLSEILNGPLFDKLRKERPNDLNKIIPIHGDITSEELGISESDQALLSRTVSVVFHSAATVKFDEKLKLSVTINMLGTKRLVQLCQRMISLDVSFISSSISKNTFLMFISTRLWYMSQQHTAIVIDPMLRRQFIHHLTVPMTSFLWFNGCLKIFWIRWELFSPNGWHLRSQKYANWIINLQLTPSLIGNRPNTYTFTKALAESMLLKEAGNLPVAIVRPSIGEFTLHNCQKLLFHYFKSQPQQYYRASMSRLVDGWTIGTAQLELFQLWGKEFFTQSCAMRRALLISFQLTWWVPNGTSKIKLTWLRFFNWIVVMFRSSTWWWRQHGRQE